MFMVLLYSAYIVTLAFLLYMAFLLVRLSGSKAAAALLCCDISLTVIIFGMFLEVMMAQSVTAALVCLKLQYLGQAIFLMSQVYFFSIFLHVRVPLWIYGMQVIVNVCVLSACMTAESHTYFYSAMEIVTDGPYPMILVEDGFFWYLHYAHLFLVMFYVIGASLIRYRKSSARQKQRCGYLLAGVGIMTGELVLKGMGLFGSFNPFVFVVFIYTVCLYQGLIRCGYFDTLEAAMHNVLDQSDESILVVNEKERVIYMNAQMGEMFPALRVGGAVRCAELLDEIFEGRREIRQDDQYYRAILEDVRDGDIRDGQTLRLIDMTEYQERMERLRRENESKTDFLARVSHEIRTPLNTINGMNEMIRRETREPQTLAYAKDVREATKVLLSLVKDMMDLTRIEQAAMTLELTELSARQLFSRLWAASELKCRRKGLTLSFQIDPGLPEIWIADETRIYQIIENLLSNAVKYTEKGSVTLSAKKDGVRAIMISVRDTGIGIDQEDIDKIFYRFEQLETGHKRQGLGLGLDIVHKLTERLGGTVSVESEVGKGSTFILHLPMNFGEGEETVGKAWRMARSEEGECLVYRCPGKRILVVDDNEMNRKVIQNFLKGSGIETDEAESGADCLARYPLKSYDLLFLDHMMPEMDGIEVFHRLTELPAYQQAPIPVVAMTANALKGARQKFLLEGFDDYIAKPVDAKSLFELLQEYLGGTLENVAVKEPEENRDSLEESGLADRSSRACAWEEFSWLSELGADLTLAKKYADGSADFFRRELEIFQRNMPKEAGELERDLGRDDRKSLRIRVHALKNNLATIGFVYLSKRARQLEEQLALEEEGKAPDNKTLEEEVRYLAREIRRVAEP